VATVRILHTADIHLGMRFAGYPPDLAEQLTEARWKTFNNLISLANDRKCDVFLVAGDLFDSHRVLLKDVERAADALKGFDGSLAVVMPGNHDYVSDAQKDLWARFQEVNRDCLLLTKAVPYRLGDYGISAVLYPAPCTSKISSENAVGWVQSFPKDDTIPFRLGIAHGSLDGFSPDPERRYYPMTIAELERSGVDIWLMGHTHVRRPDKDTGQGFDVLFPGTPEPDGSDCRHAGHAWVVELKEGKPPSYRSHMTGIHQFVEIGVELANERSLVDLEKRLRSLPSGSLVTLTVTGSLPADVHDRLGEWVSRLEASAQIIRFERDVTRQVSLREIDAEFTAGTLPHRLLTELAKHEGDARSVQVAYDIIREARQ
jgi:exonuclease SbcD